MNYHVQNKKSLRQKFKNFWYNDIWAELDIVMGILLIITSILKILFDNINIWSIFVGLYGIIVLCIGIYGYRKNIKNKIKVVY